MTLHLLLILPNGSAHHLQLQLDRFHTYTTMKGLMLNAHKTKIMAFFCSNLPVFCYKTLLKNVQEFKDLGIIIPMIKALLLGVEGGWFWVGGKVL